MGKTRDLFKKIRDIKGTFHAKMGSIKDRNGMDLTKQKILRKDGKNTQKNYIKKPSVIPGSSQADLQLGKNIPHFSPMQGPMMESQFLGCWFQGETARASCLFPLQLLSPQT